MDELVKAYYDEAKDSMEKAVVHVELELQKIRAGKAMPNMLDGVQVDYYGSMVPLSQVANISTPDPRSLMVQPWEKAMIQPVETAIINSNLGMAPGNDGNVIRISIPPLTEERRKDLVKKAKGEGENCKIAIRNIRKDAMSNIKSLKDDGVSEDAVKEGEDEAQKLTNDFIGKVDRHIERKEVDIMTV
ncbi:MAG: ribosome recycling factor [Sphingobacteriales bacterium]|jgi:ribosome recycling factor